MARQVSAMATEHKPDLILMDIQLPVMDGYEVTRRIKADPALWHIPIIAVTSYALSGDEAKTKAGRLRWLYRQALQSPAAARKNQRASAVVHKLPSDLLHAHRPALENERGVPSDNEQPANARKGSQQVFRDPVREILLLGVAAHVGEREDGYGGLVR